MSLAQSPPSRPGGLDRPLLTAGALGLGALLLTAVVLLTMEGEALLLVGLAVGLAGLVAVLILRPSPAVRLSGVLLLQVFQLRGEAGTTPLEAVAGLALIAYLVHWYADVWLCQRHTVLSLFDAAALTWGGLGLVGGMVLGQIFGANAYDFRADVIATIPFLLYLPVKDLCARHPRGPLLLAAVLVAFGLVASVQNALQFRAVISGATEVWEIADARFAAGETSITVGLLLCFAGSALSRSLRLRIGLLALVGVLLGGLILAKSRGFWVASMVGLLTIGAMGDPQARRRLGLSVGLGVLALAAIGLTFFADEMLLLASGAFNRLLSLSSAGQDISLLNRFAESAGAWERIRVNPILGYGWGVQVTHYSLIAQGTSHWAFLHNGYLALWLKTGLWGLALMAFVWGGAMLRGAWAARSPLLPAADRAVALGAIATLTAFVLTVFTSNPFSIFDQMLIVTLTLALAHGVADRGAAHGRVAEQVLAHARRS